MTDCLFPFDHPATVAVWLLVAVGLGWWYGGVTAAQVGEDPGRYRERWGYRPRTSLIAVTLVMLTGLVPLAGQLLGASFCDAMFFGWFWLLISPWTVTALARAIVPMARLARADD